MEWAKNPIMLIAGYGYSHPRSAKASDGNVQPMGAVHSKNHLLRFSLK
jgi:hypothetical protein